MALLLRIDVDKPYGNHTLIRKIFSKFFEETGLPCSQFCYLDHLEATLEILDSQQVKGMFYFRICSLPTKKLVQRMIERGHKIGWHLEDSRDFTTFQKELKTFEVHTGLKPHSFSKHGSGELKLGRYHYPPYEPEKYKDWSRRSAIPFYFGNSTFSLKSSISKSDFFPDMFWIERNYRNPEFSSLDEVLKKSKDGWVVVLTHPESIIRNLDFKKDLLYLIEKAKIEKIEWCQL